VRAQPYTRALLARAYAAVGDTRAAEAEARRALETSERIGLPFVTSLACAVAVRLEPAVKDREALRERGRAALDTLIDGAPEDRRDAVRGRKDLAYLAVRE